MNTIELKASYNLKFNCVSHETINSNTICIGMEDSIRVFNIEAGKFSSEIILLPSNLLSFKIINESKVICSLLSKKLVCIDILSGKTEFSLPSTEPIKYIRCLGNYVVGVSQCGLVSIIDILNSKDTIGKYQSQIKDVIACTILSNGDIVISSKEGIVKKINSNKLLDSQNSTEENIITSVSNVTCLDSFNNSTTDWIVAGTSTGSIEIINESGNSIISLKTHTKSIKKVYSDGSIIFSCDTKSSSCFWKYRQNRHYKQWTEAFRE